MSPIFRPPEGVDSRWTVAWATPVERARAATTSRIRRRIPQPRQCRPACLGAREASDQLDRPGVLVEIAARPAAAGGQLEVGEEGDRVAEGVGVGLLDVGQEPLAGLRRHAEAAADCGGGLARVEAGGNAERVAEPADDEVEQPGKALSL